MEGQDKPATVVKCEKHGLHYDSAKFSGCVRCRREAGELPPVGAGAAAAAAQPSGALGPALGVTLLLLALTAFVLHTLHLQIVSSIKSMRSPGAAALESPADRDVQQMEREMREMGSPGGAEDYSEGPEAD